jgi:hypothetical protein
MNCTGIVNICQDNLDKYCASGIMLKLSGG